MDFPKRFIAATTAYTDEPVFSDKAPAPYLRRVFQLDRLPDKADMLICGQGFYELYINGARVTRGALAPFISNPDHLLYYDAYDVRPWLREGENVIGVWLGNGFFNNPGGLIWDFDKAPWRGAPCVALRLDMEAAGVATSIESGREFVAAPSPVLYDDYRFGEWYDARRELSGWAEPGYDASDWRPALDAPLPRGETVLNAAPPVGVTAELPAVAVTPLDDGYLYDFGVNTAGVCRLSLTGRPGQELSFEYGERRLDDGRLDMRNVTCRDGVPTQRGRYTCKGGEERYTPVFIYYGFRYVFVRGMTAEQAVPGALTCLVMNTLLEERGGFRCSDETANTLQEMTRRSTLANFHHFPTDCPQREKNGWTADAALSAEHTLLNLAPEVNYRQWLHGIRKAMDDRGALPGIVPTAGWGFAWGNGPAWDCVLACLPYYTWLYRGDLDIVKDNAHALLRYLDYIMSRIGGDGLIAIGLGDWCPVGRGPDQYKAPLALTDTILSMDIAEKSGRMFDALGLPLQAAFAYGLRDRLRAAVRERLVDWGTMTAEGCCQTSQAMALFYNVFDTAEKPAAFRRLMDIIRRDGHVMDVGVLGGRVLFHVLADGGEADLAYDMITRRDYPSYGVLITRGATSLWEEIQPEGSPASSRNHHFWGDISHWFLRWLAGIHYNPRGRGGEADIRPQFVGALEHAEGWHDAPEGRIAVQWRREDGGGIVLDVTYPADLKGTIRMPEGYVFDDDTSCRPASSGRYVIHSK